MTGHGDHGTPDGLNGPCGTSSSSSPSNPAGPNGHNEPDGHDGPDGHNEPNGSGGQPLRRLLSGPNGLGTGSARLSPPTNTADPTPATPPAPPPDAARADSTPSGASSVGSVPTGAPSVGIGPPAVPRPSTGTLCPEKAAPEKPSPGPAPLEAPPADTPLSPDTAPSTETAPSPEAPLSADVLSPADVPSPADAPSAAPLMTGRLASVAILGSSLSTFSDPEHSLVAPFLTAFRPAPSPLASPTAEPPSSAPSQRIEGLYAPPAVRDDPALAEEVNARIVEWAEKEVDLYPETDLRADLLGFDAGRSVVLCHPDAVSIDHLMAAARLLIAENAVDDYFCEVEYGGSADRRGAALAVAQSAIDPAHNVPRYESDWRNAVAADPALRAMRSAMDYFQELATPAQAHRFRHDIANLYLGYNAEGDCISQHRTPAVWEYLVQRQFNNFRPCLTLTDSVGGYELPAHLFADPGVQRAVALSSNASTICNDLYSLRKEQASGRFHYSLPTVIAEEEGCSIHDAFQAAIEVHNDIVHSFEEQAAALSADPLVARFVTGLSNWLGGNHEWHMGNVGTRYATSP